MELIEALEEFQEAAGDITFEIDNDGKADWALRKIAELNADTKAWRDYYAQQLEKITEKNQASIDYFTSMLEYYFNQIPHRKTKTGRESYKLPSGTISRRPQQPEYNVDHTAMVEYLQNRPGGERYLKPQPPKPNWADFKKEQATLTEISDKDPITGELITRLAVLDAETGEIVGAVTVTPRPDIFEAVPSAKKEDAEC